MRQSWAQNVVLSGEDGLIPAASPQPALGSWPGLLTLEGGDAVPWCSSSMVWPRLLGFFQLRNPLAFTLRCEPDVGHLALQGRGHSRRPLTTSQLQSAWGGGS